MAGPSCPSRSSSQTDLLLDLKFPSQNDCFCCKGEHSLYVVSCYVLQRFAEHKKSPLFQHQFGTHPLLVVLLILSSSYSLTYRRGCASETPSKGAVCRKKKKTWAISSGIVGEAETTGAAGRDKSAKASKGFGLSCHRLRQRDVNQLQRKTGPHFLSPCLQRTLFSRRGEERPSFKDSAELTPTVHVCPPPPLPPALFLNLSAGK